MTPQPYERDLDAARQKLAELLDQREQVEVQIAKMKRRIALLTELCDEEGILVPVLELELGGLTEACRTVFRSRQGWMNTTEVMSGLRELGFPLSRYKAPMASITTTVNRMAEAGELEINKRLNPGATEYRWKATLRDLLPRVKAL